VEEAGRGTGVEETGSSHPDGVGSGAKGSSPNTGAGCGAGTGIERPGRSRHGRPDVRALVFAF
jgi:hypothetical protein